MKNKEAKVPVAGKAVRVPFVMQMEELECGAACLAMVLAYFGKWVPLEQLRVDCGISRDGSNAKNLILAARSYGLEAKGVRCSVESLKTQMPFPCILFWEFNHFVVLDGFDKKNAIINDPARGRVKIPMERFNVSFTGVCIRLATTERFEKGGKPKSILSFAKKRLKGSGPAFAFTIITMVISSLYGIIDAGTSRAFLDYLLGGKNPSWLYPFLAFMVAMLLVNLAAGWIGAIYSRRIEGKMDLVGTTTYMWKVLRLPMEFYSQRSAGDLQLRMSENASVTRDLIEMVIPLAIDSAMMVFYLTVMLRNSLILTVIGLGVFLMNTVINQYIVYKRINHTRVQMRDTGKKASYSLAGFQTIESIKASGAEDGFFEKWAGYQASVNAQDVAMVRETVVVGLIPAILSQLANYLVLVVGVWLCMQGEFTPGMILAFQGYLSSFLGPAYNLASTGSSIQEMRTSMERIEDVMEYPSDSNVTREVQEGEDYSKLTGQVSLRNVTFGYSRLGKPLIEDFSLELKTGSRVALVGSSGCGKSTLSKLISGLYTPWSGEILFDGKPIQEIDHNVFTGSLAVVDQDIILFEDTIRNNITMWDQSLEDFEVILAARDAQIHEDILKRPGGYSSKLMENGKNLSGGQRQRLEIARVLVQDPTIIILDEATSALDAKTEYEVISAIKNRGITCIVVAHRLSTIRDSDEIVVLDQGKVVERGTHEELFAKGGYYTELVTSE